MNDLPSGVTDEIEALAIEVGPDQVVSGLLRSPPEARACYVLAHGAGAGMRHGFLEAIATGLAEQGFATLRYQFPYMERGGRQPDRPELAHATVRAAIEAAGRSTNLPLVAGGKSFGGRMTSQAQALSPLPGVRGLAFLGFPLHPAGRPARDRGAHLADVDIPMLFLQGTRDDLAHLDQLQLLCQELGDRANLVLLSNADHSFRVPARSSRRDEEVRVDLLNALASWIDRLVAQPGDVTSMTSPRALASAI